MAVSDSGLLVTSVKEFSFAEPGLLQSDVAKEFLSGDGGSKRSRNTLTKIARIVDAADVAKKFRPSVIVYLVGLLDIALEITWLSLASATE